MPSLKSNNTDTAPTVGKSDVASAMGENLMVTLGDSGTERYAGYLMEEYKSEWRDERRIELVESMRRGDATARAGLRAIKAPLLATKWSVMTEDETPKGEEIRLFVEQNLFGMKGRSWKKFLREALSYLDFGFYCFEILWEMRDGKVCLKDLAPRIPHSIVRWRLDNGEFGVQQQLKTDEALGKPAFVEIPAKKMLILTNDQEGDDVTGQSVLRSAWKHWSLKETLYKIQGIAAERFGVGVPVITMDGKAGTTEKAEAEDWGKAMRSNQKGYVVLPSKEWDVKILTPTGNPQGEAIVSSIEHHDKAMLHALLAAFIMLGSGSGGGSYNLGENLLYFFFKSCEDMADYVKEEVLNQVVKQLVDLNFGEQEIYPTLNYAPLGDMDTVEMSGVLKTLADGGLILKDSRLLEYVHNAFKLPSIPDEVLEQMKEAELENGVAGIGADAEDAADAEVDKEEADAEDPEKEVVAPKKVAKNSAK